MQVRVQAETVVKASAASIWPLMTDVAHGLEWRAPYVVQLKQLTHGPVGPGTRFAGTTRILRQTETYTTEVTVYQPEVRYVWRGIGSSAPIMGSGSYNWRSVSEACVCA
jgi:hypothetical protein